MKWRLNTAPGPTEYIARVGVIRFYVTQWGRVWIAGYDDAADGCTTLIGEYRTERQAKTYAYRRAKALVERMVREVRDA